MDTTVADPLVGRVLDGRYAIRSRIARGGMATVYLAVDQRLDREVALKVMLAGLAGDDDFVRRFNREARSAARLSHPGVVSVYDQGEDDGLIFLVMEYVPGHTLRDLLNERGRLSPRDALAILTPVLEALATAHWHGLIHRDIKPENVLLADDGRIKVADFGLARAVSAGTNSQHSNVLLGTVAYLAPEQVERGVADARSDVYAAGILFFEMLTGRKPFEGDTPIQVAYQHVHHDVPPPSSLVPGLAPGLDLLVTQAAARNPDDRPADAGELLESAHRTRATLTQAELDGTPTAVPPPPAGEATVLVPSVEAGAWPFALAPAPQPMAGASSTAGSSYPSGYAPTGVLDLPGPPPGAPGDPAARSHRGRTWAIVIVVLALLLGFAGWYLGAGPGASVSTPNVIRMTSGQALAALKAKGLSDKEVQVFSETVPAGYVAATDPGPGASVSKHGTVTVDVSKGPERHAVPTLAGTPTSDAEDAITQAKLAVGSISKTYSDTVPSGDVISSDPVAGTLLAPGKTIDLVVSQGPAPVTLGDWTDQPIDQATQVLQQAGLKVKTTQASSMKVAKGDIVSQKPGPGTVHRGDTVTFVVSSGPPLVNVPDVTGKQVGDARQILKAAGFQVHVRNVLGGFFGTVRLESPSGNSQAPKGSVVTITVV